MLNRMEFKIISLEAAQKIVDEWEHKLQRGLDFSDLVIIDMDAVCKCKIYDYYSGGVERYDVYRLEYTELFAALHGLKFEDHDPIYGGYMDLESYRKLAADGMSADTARLFYISPESTLYNVDFDGESSFIVDSKISHSKISKCDVYDTKITNSTMFGCTLISDRLTNRNEDNQVITGVWD